MSPDKATLATEALKVATHDQVEENGGLSEQHGKSIIPCHRIGSVLLHTSVRVDCSLELQHCKTYMWRYMVHMQ